MEVSLKCSTKLAHAVKMKFWQQKNIFLYTIRLKMALIAGAENADQLTEMKFVVEDSEM